MNIVYESENSHGIDNYGKNTLSFRVEDSLVFIRVQVEGKDHEIDFDMEVEDFENLVEVIRSQIKYDSNQQKGLGPLLSNDALDKMGII